MHKVCSFSKIDFSVSFGGFANYSANYNKDFKEFKTCEVEEQNQQSFKLIQL